MTPPKPIRWLRDRIALLTPWREPTRWTLRECWPVPCRGCWRIVSAIMTHRTWRGWRCMGCLRWEDELRLRAEEDSR